MLRAGLWEKDARLSPYNEIDYSAIMRLAEEQSVVGVVAAGLEHVIDVKVPQVFALQFAGQTIQLEQRNTAMNHFIAGLIEQLRKVDVYTLLLKGQGIAQCYERPLWRACGDIDLFLDNNDYERAKNYLMPLAQYVEIEYQKKKHLAFTISTWEVELHGTLRCLFWKRWDRVIDDIQRDTFVKRNVRVWVNNNTDIYLPYANNDVFFVFTHILQHFYKGGIGLRQICDWCRLLRTYKETLNHNLLESRIKSAGLMSEWKAFGALAVEYLGMPIESMPFYSNKNKWHQKARKIIAIVMETGNFGHNRERAYRGNKSFIVKKLVSFYMHTYDNLRHVSIFPIDSVKVWYGVIKNGLSVAIRGN